VLQHTRHGVVLQEAAGQARTPRVAGRQGTCGQLEHVGCSLMRNGSGCEAHAMLVCML
jgi:hypothetical protein